MPSAAPLVATLLLAHASAAAAAVAANNVMVTPHDSYSSSIGVLGCKVNTDRVAYWPETVTCDNICVSVSYGDRQLYLLRIDQSGGAHDISYDAWNYLYTGKSATEAPAQGGGVAMTAQAADPAMCRDLIHTDNGALPLSAANSMNYLSSCLGSPGSWVARNYALYNILNPICTLGYDEKCSLDWPAQNQATCPHQLGMPAALTSAPVTNIRYPSGKPATAGSPGARSIAAKDDKASAAVTVPVAGSLLALVGATMMLAMH